ncbi:unnamed protein product [Calypogeia fissa]
MWTATPKGAEFGLGGTICSTRFKPCIRQCGHLLENHIQNTFLSSAARSGSVLHEPFRVCSSVNDIKQVFHNIEDNSSEAWLVDEFTTPFNQISVIEVGSDADHEFAGAYILKLDGRDLVHSVYWHDQRVWTGAYYDEFTILPALVPPGPIAILGLGAGTVARLLVHEWPSRKLEGWEIDPEVVRVGRAYFGLADLEVSRQGNPKYFDRKGRGQHVHNKVMARGELVVHVGDALKEDAMAEGRFAGLIVDMYSKGRICEALKDCCVWPMLRRRLIPGGRVMVNCGGPPVANREEEVDQKAVLETEEWKMGVDATISAFSEAFNGEVNLKQLEDEGRNVILLSGPLPTLERLCVKSSSRLMSGIQGWHPLG